MISLPPSSGTPSSASGSSYITLEFSLPTKTHLPYPDSFPALLILCGSLPSYIKKYILRQAVSHASQSLLGAPFLYDVVMHVEENLSAWIEDPGSLVDLAGETMATPNNKNATPVQEDASVSVAVKNVSSTRSKNQCNLSC
jgi:hypothetical protein